RALSCRYCGKVFIHSKRLQSHEGSCRVPGLRPPSLTVQPKEEPLEDGEAGDAAATELLAGDENHFVKVVDGNVIYFCSVCERSYMTLSSLKRHSNVHSWRRKYPCHYCDKVFALAEYRTKHEVWHTGERRYQCIFCWDAFATYYNLKTHQKTIHGINPSLISSEKTANGGYKQKANALKLYRLLPMRSQKRPYKTYSDSLHNGLLLPPADAPSLSMTGLGCALGPGRGTEAGMPSVITYGHTKPSVIVHGAAVSSSVIVHSNQVTSGSEKSPVTSPSPETGSSQILTKGSPKAIKKQRDSTDNHRKRSRDSSDTTDECSKGRHDTEIGRAFHKPRKSHNKSANAAPKEASASGGSQAKESGPLCQITVRIGEEAIVKRSISETDLKRGRASLEEDGDKEAGEDEEEVEEQESRNKRSKSPDQDNLWRPYYSYKPKKKAQAHLQRVKNWQRKLKYKRSIRLKRRAERLKRLLNKQTEKSQDEEEDRTKCGTCGRWFSSPRKRDKHELSHLLDNSSPNRLSRRALSRHTCPQCHKVCKTSSALTRHIRRHDLRQTPSALSVSVISYSPPELPSGATGLKAQASRQVHSSSQGLDRLTLPTGAAGAAERPSAHALLLPRASQPPEPDHQGDTTPADYPTQDYPLPLIVPDSYRSVKKQEENLLMSTYPPGALPFGPLGKVIVPDGGDLGKLPFYPDPYQLLYGPQLLAYPYNLAALPVALNMMAPGGDKVEPLPFLPTIFNYAATAGPYMGAAPHPLVANPGLYSSGGSGKKQRDGSG
uniref:Zinc finger and BTB domain containing 4 n=1 Tax=Poecilia formosa TaxID=48698 RepID=A0A087XQR2_POEFO